MNKINGMKLKNEIILGSYIEKLVCKELRMRDLNNTKQTKGG